MTPQLMLEMIFFVHIKSIIGINKLVSPFIIRVKKNNQKKVSQPTLLKSVND